MRSIPRKISALLTAVALFGCANEVPAPIPRTNAETPRRGGSMTIASFGDIRTIDPAAIGDGLVPMILEGLFAGLVDYDAESHIVPSLAERWTIEDGGRTFRFFLREGAKFQDGDEVTADDVKRSCERALHASAPNPYAPYFASIDGYDAFHAGKTEHLDGVVVEGRYVVTFHLKGPDATFLPLLAMEILRPVCKSGGARYSDAWDPCGAGPYKLQHWDHGRGVDIVRNDFYFRPGLPHLDGVHFLFHVNQTAQLFKFTRGDLDVYRDWLAPDLLRYQADPRWTPFGEYEGDKVNAGEAMNTEMPPFDNIEIRRAVAAAIDREELRLLRPSNLRALDQPIPAAVFGHDDAIHGQHFDYAAALEHMKRAGYAYDPVRKTGGWPEVVPITVYKQGLEEFVAQVLVQQLAKIGIRIEIRVVSYATFLALRGRRREVAFGSGFWQQDYPEGESFLEPLFSSSSINDADSNNWAFYKNPRVDELIEHAKHELDDDARKKLYSSASQIICDDAPWAFTYTYRYFIQRQPYVRDFRLHPVASYEFSDVWLDRAAGPVAARAIFSKNAVARIFGESR